MCKLTLQRQQPNSASSSHSRSSSPTAPAAAADGDSQQTPAEWVEESSFVIGADGARSTLCTAMTAAADKTSGFSVKRFEDNNTIVYRTLPLFWPKEFAESRPGDVNHSARTKSGISLDCLPTREGPFIGVMLYK